MANKFTSFIDAFMDHQGRIGALLIIPLCMVVIFEVIMRYIFNSPTVWGFEATTFLYGIHYMLGLGYTELHNGHVKVDIITVRLSQKSATILAIITNCVIFLPVMSCLTFWSGRFALESTLQMERNSTSWAPPIWPIKIVMALSFLFLLMEGISKLVRDIQSLRSLDKKL